jgi:hypothetical protein
MVLPTLLLYPMEFLSWVDSPELLHSLPQLEIFLNQQTNKPDSHGQAPRDHPFSQNRIHCLHLYLHLKSS